MQKTKTLILAIIAIMAAATIAVYIPQAAAAPTVLTNSPAVATVVSGSPGWYQPTNAYDNDNDYAASNTVVGGAVAKQMYSHYGFNIPPTATITSVKVKLDAQLKTFIASRYITVEVSANGGSSWLSASNAGPLTNAKTTYTVDVTGWTTWAPSNINNDKIWVRVTQVGASSATYTEWLYWIPIEVTYNVPLTATTTTTQLSESGIQLGGSVTDTATVTTGATGDVRFEVSTDGVSFAQYGAAKTLSGGSPNTATSDPYTPAAGTYYFRAVYAGDVNYAGSQSVNDAEVLMVTSFVVPEYLFGGLAALGACLAALVVVKRKSIPKLRSHN